MFLSLTDSPLLYSRVVGSVSRLAYLVSGEGEKEREGERIIRRERKGRKGGRNRYVYLYLCPRGGEMIFGALAKEAGNVNNSRRRSRRTVIEIHEKIIMISKPAWSEDIELCTRVYSEEEKKML